MQKIMIYLKSFKEAVIIPSKMETGHINSFETLKEYGDKNGFDVVDYEEFYQSLSDEDKKTAPPKMGTPFFALYHLERKKPMFVLVDKNVVRFMPNFKEIVDDIIGHERVHAGQVARRKGGDYVLPNPNDSKQYFSNKEEIMAFSWTIANDIAKLSKDFDTAVARFKSGRFGFQTNQLWSDIVRVCDSDVVNRYRKMIYQYLDKMFKKVNESHDSELIHKIQEDEFVARLSNPNVYTFTQREIGLINQFFKNFYDVQLEYNGARICSVRDGLRLREDGVFFDNPQFIIHNGVETKKITKDNVGDFVLVDNYTLVVTVGSRGSFMSPDRPYYVNKDDDDWYYVYIVNDGEHFKCDSLEGLFKFFEGEKI